MAIENAYLDEVLTDSQLKRLERKAKRQNKKSNVVDIAFKPEAEKVLPKNDKQASLIDAIHRNTQVIAHGSAGTGKTFVAASLAAELFIEGHFKKIVIIRPNIPTGKSIGFLPGEVDDKMTYWCAPVLNVLRQSMGEGTFEIAQKRKDIEIVPMEFIRGYSFEDAFVIVDETQNITVEESKSLVTRIGMGSKLVVCGDVVQTDLRGQSGLGFLIDSVAKYPKLQDQIAVVEFGPADVVRSDLCGLWVQIFEQDAA